MCIRDRLTGALTAAFAQADQRLPAALTLVTTASGMAAFGIGAAFWGLMVGLAVWGLEHLKLRRA